MSQSAFPLTSVDEGDSFEQWHQVTCRNYSVTQCDAQRNQGFRASIIGRDLGDIAICQIASTVSGDSPLCVTRTACDIRQDRRDDFLLWVAQEGEVMFEQHDRSVRLRHGDIMLHDQAYPFSLTFSNTSASTIVRIPRDTLTPWLPGAENLVAMRLPGESALARISSLVVSELYRETSETELSVMTVRRLCAGAMQIWSAAFNEAFQPCLVQSQDARLQRAQRYMSERLHETDMTSASVAAGIGVSTRTLLRLFASLGTTPMRWLWSQRLAASHDVLTCGKARSVTEVALTFGFRDLSHFCRSFKATFGISARVAMLGGNGSDAPDATKTEVG
ncbi:MULTISPECIES: helix-turn-helix domain-containing protein [Burkholderia]|uniref:AraC family transcriptional regulator n=1 Tax=Burkholderia paludis TaxID=1506587 RepID=A0A6P2RJY9_9BURK|nr:MULTISPECIES: helix-turn-helix domain-containing protein [Burkholderia]CAB3774071.1 Transcriptional activator NphR [Burkholderia paludis]VWC36619.1 AraC family transcriptional regulator [Burkholderia paludis]